jgi:nucleoside 2-deoxyribosyltransferase
MNIYFSCSLTGGRKDEVVYGRIVDALLAAGHDVPTAHLARPDVMALERVVDPGEVYRRDIEWVEACEALVAEVSTPSHGVGYEIAHALSLGKPVLCFHHQAAHVSKMITGNSMPTLRLAEYADIDQAIAIVEAFLSDVKQGGPSTERRAR